MARTSDKTGAYEGIGTALGGSDSGSDLIHGVAEGIGTRISAACARLGTRKYAAHLMGVSTDQLQRYLREDNQPTFVSLVRLCEASGTNLAWMATGEGPERVGDAAPAVGTSHDVSEEHLTIALELADNALGRDRWLPRPKYALLVRLLYQGIANGLPQAQITQLAGALAGSMAPGGGNVGQSRVGESGQGGTSGGGSAAPGQGNG